MGSLIYAKSGSTLTLESARFAHGYIAPQDGQVYYHTTDHLGSVRAITNMQGSVVERNGYYPFGSETALGSSYPKLLDNRMKFNGKEVQTTGNLGLLDYGARMYDPAIGRWTAQDPLAEEMYNLSPYRFSLNDPINYVDPNGLFESRKDARKYRREHDDVSGRISKNEDGSFSIINNNEGVIYTRTNQTESLVVDEEGVERAALVTPYTNNENPIIQGIYNAQNIFLNHPVTQITCISLFGLTTVGIVSQISVLDVNRYKTFNCRLPLFWTAYN